ncbi:uncharacterized protein LOC127805519 [Diospyros lotus]|uniref:uncharacterized protein LOC127805519 n=1 Tax=Diospyros lotus TaxID=55363 RepID=UPI00224C887E|nr:uncharacterized protein LOC127805519 [Diospyros lotus]
MEIIPELSIISGFEAGMNCLQNPSLIHWLFSDSGIGKAVHVYGFWKWGALILALVATFCGVITRIKLLVLRLCEVQIFRSQGASFRQLDSEYDSDEDEDDSGSLDSSDGEGFRPATAVEQDYCVAGSSSYGGDRRGDGSGLRLRRRISGDRFSWSDFAGGRSVVKMWDNFSFGLDFEENFSRSVVSMWDLNRDQKVSSFSCGKLQIPALSSSSPAVVLSGGTNNGCDKFLLGVYDARSGQRIPAISAEWRLPRGKAVGISSGGVEKVYVIDDAACELTVGDIRKPTSPLENPMASDGGIWWDSDAVIVQGNDVDGCRVPTRM